MTISPIELQPGDVFRRTPSSEWREVLGVRDLDAQDNVPKVQENKIEVRITPTKVMWIYKNERVSLKQKPNGKSKSRIQHTH